LFNMGPLFYLVIGLIAGGFIAGVVVLLVRRESNGGVSSELVKRLEIVDRSLRDEFSRNREEAGAAAKNQREELTKSLDNVGCRSPFGAITRGQREATRQDARDRR